MCFARPQLATPAMERLHKVAAGSSEKSPVPLDMGRVHSKGNQAAAFTSDYAICNTRCARDA